MISPHIPISELALQDPRLAYWFMRSRKSPSSFSIRATFDSIEANTVIKGNVPTAMGTDFYVCDMCFGVYRFNAFEESVFKAQSDLCNAKMPGIDLDLQISGIYRYTLACDQGPIEAIARHTDSPVADCWLKGWVLQACETVKTLFTLKKALADDEIPYTVILTIKGMQLDCKNFGEMDQIQAWTLLKNEYPQILPTNPSSIPLATAITSGK